MKEPKICFVINSLTAGGAERAVSGLANHFIQLGHEVCIITFVKMSPFYTLNEKIELAHCLDGSTGKITFIDRSLNSVRRFRKLYENLKRLKPDVVISFMTVANIYTLLTTKLLRLPCIISERANHNIVVLTKGLRITRNLCYPWSKALVVQTEMNKAFYSGILEEKKIAVIPNAIAPNLQTLKSTSKVSRANTILNIGSFKDGKAQDLLIRAFARLPKNNWKLIFLGDGNNRKRFEGLAEEMGVGAQTYFLGNQKNVANYYNSEGLFVFTSEHEGFPNALLEALYFGMPTISTDCPHGPSELIENGHNGYLIPVGDENALKKKLEILMNDGKLQHRLGENALKTTKKYEMSQIAEQWKQLIKKITQ